MSIAQVVILSGAKNLPSSRLDVRGTPLFAHMRGGIVAWRPRHLRPCRQNAIDVGRQECPPHPLNVFLDLTVWAGSSSHALGPPGHVGANVPPATSRRMTEDARVSSDAAVDPSSACLPVNRCQAGRLPQDDMFGRGHDGDDSPRAIATHVILSGAKNLPSSRVDVQRKPSPARMRGGLVSLAASSAMLRAESHNHSFLSFHSELTYI